MVEYDVLYNRDQRWSGNIDPQAMREELNQRAKEGWRLVTSFAYYAMLKSNRAEIALILERPVPPVT